MRKLPLALLAPAFTLALVLPAHLDAQAVNPLQLALLKWAPYSGDAFPVGSGPVGLAFDGASIWVANYTSFSVSKLRASDGAVLGTFGVANPPGGLAFGLPLLGAGHGQPQQFDQGIRREHIAQAAGRIEFHEIRRHRPAAK